jgi:hypothetical protein
VGGEKPASEGTEGNAYKVYEVNGQIKITLPKGLAMPKKGLKRTAN